MRNRLLVLTLMGLLAACGDVPTEPTSLEPGLSFSTSTPPATIDLTGTVRDFKAYHESGGHPDFESYLGFQTGIVESTLGSDGKPVFNATQGVVTSEETFNQWYRDVDGVNLNLSHTVTLNHDGGGVYSYNSDVDGGFFPIDGQGFGNYSTSGHNFHFTYEIHTTFTYQGGETFTFSGDDDLWVFINDELVIDIGGVHGAITRSVNLDDLPLTLGNDYDIDLFFAERRTSGSNFRITTSIQLVPVNPDPDSDGDGIDDDVDAYPNSNLDPTVTVGSCDSGVANQVLDSGASFMDLIGAAADAARNHGQFVNAVSKLADGWKKDGLISGRDKGSITSCAARSK